MDNKLETYQKKRLIVGISGASGAILGINILELLRGNPEWETHLIITDGARRTIEEETEYPFEKVISLADKAYAIKNIGAGLASGTFKTEGMVIVPCSMKTVAGIAAGYSDNLLLRAADVTLKEGRRLILAPRECPLSTIHLRNLLTLAEAGAMVVPPMLTYYNKPQSIEDVNRHFIGKILDKFDIQVPEFKRWE